MNAEIESFLNYLIFEKRYSRLTTEAYKTDLEQFSLHCAEKLKLPNIADADYNDIRTWVLQLMTDKLEAVSVNRKIACLKSFYKFLNIKGRLNQNPAARLKSPKIKKRLPVFVEQKAMDMLFEASIFDNDFAGQRDKLVFELLYGTGMRLAELIGLKSSDIDTYNLTIRVLGKGNKVRILPMHKNLVETINLYNKLKYDTFLNSDTSAYLVVTDKGEQAYPMLIQRIVKKYLNVASNADKKSPHVLRHTFATHMLNNGADLNAIKELLGHSGLAATQVYTHNSMEKLKSIFKQAHPKA